MNRWLKVVVPTAVVVGGVVGLANADYNVTQGAGTVMFAFTCFTTKVCPAHVVTNNAGTEIFTAAAPAQVSLANTGANATKILVTPDSVALPANQSVNVAQINGVAPLMGAGATGTGSHRVTTASDSPEISLLTSINTNVQAGAGTTASAVPASGIYTGCRGQNAEPTAVTNGQLVGEACDLVGKQITLPYANPENFVSGSTAAMTATTSTSVVASAGGALRNYITACTFSNSHATVGTMILLQDGSGGATLWQAPAAAVFGGAHVVFPTPIRTTAATALFAANVTTGANTFVSCTGYKGV
jgi:hypothetical protein